MIRLTNNITFRRKSRWRRSCGLLSLHHCAIGWAECL